MSIEILDMRHWFYAILSPFGKCRGRFLLFTFSLLLFSACQKDKLDTKPDYSSEKHVASAVRIINLTEYNHVIVNGDTLTNMAENEIPTTYFQENGELGSRWWFPESLFDSHGNAEVELTGEILGVSGGHTYSPKVKFTLSNNGSKQMDYYAMYPGGGEEKTLLVPFERDETPPSQPDHFKIRVINLMRAVDQLVVPGVSGDLEDLVGPITLAYASGDRVGLKTANVPVDQASDYIEIPYGTYQFRILTADGRQVSSATPEGSLDQYPTDPGTSSIALPVDLGSLPTYLTLTPVKTYQPGGIYTIVVAPQQMTYSGGRAYQNKFKIIENIPEPANTSYGRIQVANAVPGSFLSFIINNQDHVMANLGGVSSYKAFPRGRYFIDVQDQSGNTLTTLDYPIEAGENQTAWLWRDADGDLKWSIEYNDFSGAVPIRTTGSSTIREDASKSLYYPDVPVGVRFANFAPDQPYVNFTSRNGGNVAGGYSVLNILPGKYIIDPTDGSQTYVDGGRALQQSEEARYHLQPGVIPAYRPMLWLSNTAALQVVAYGGEPGIVPGDWLSQVAAVTNRSLIANAVLYTNIGRPTPPIEGGFFTIALVGETDNDAASGNTARFMVVRHIR